MPILKAQTYRSASKDAVVLDLSDLGRQAAKLRAIAEQKAQQILDEAHVETERLKQEATAQADQRGYEQGLERGRQEGLKAGQQQAHAQHAEQLAALNARWSAALAQHEQHVLRLQAQAKQSSLQLAIKLAEKIVHRSIETDDASIIRQVEAALDRVLEPARLRIRTHPDDRHVLERALPGLVEAVDQVTHAELVDDPEITRGGCVIQAGSATIDAQVETQLQRLAELLVGPQSEAEPETQSEHPEAPAETQDPTA